MRENTPNHGAGGLLVNASGALDPQLTNLWETGHDRAE